MEEYYIKIIDGQPIDHPFLKSNLIECYGRVPENFEPFIVSESELSLPPIGVYQKRVWTYIKHEDGISWTRFCSLVDLTEEEKQQKIDRAQSNPPGPNLVLDVETLTWKPATQKPRGPYRWDGVTGEWKRFLILPPR